MVRASVTQGLASYDKQLNPTIWGKMAQAQIKKILTHAYDLTTTNKPLPPQFLAAVEPYRARPGRPDRACRCYQPEEKIMLTLCWPRRARRPLFSAAPR